MTPDAALKQEQLVGIAEKKLAECTLRGSMACLNHSVGCVVCVILSTALEIDPYISRSQSFWWDNCIGW